MKLRDFFFRWLGMATLDTAMVSLTIILFSGKIGNGWGVLALAALLIVLLGFVAEQIWLKSLPADRNWSMAGAVITVTTVVIAVMTLGGAIWLADAIKAVAWQVWMAAGLIALVAAIQAIVPGLLPWEAPE